MKKKAISSIKYCKSLLSILINPFYLHRRPLSKFLKKYSTSCTSIDVILDLGCGEMPYKDYFSHTRYVGADVLSSGRELNRKLPSFWFDGANIPMKESSCSHALLIEVMEHIYDPHKLISDIKRILSTNGTLIFTVPFYWPIHEAPYDFNRYTRYSIEQILSDSGLELITLEDTGNIFVSFFQTMNSFIYAFTGKKLFLAFLPIFITFNLLGSILSLYKPKSNPFPLGYIVVGKKC